MQRLYIDSADRPVVERWLATGLFAGVTTNPLLLERAGLATGQLPELYGWATAAGAEEVFLQAWGREASALRQRSEELLALGERVVVKLPATETGIGVAAALARAGHRVLLTAVYDPKQALLAAAAGVAYIAPYLGRMTEAGRDGIADIMTMQRILESASTGGEVLAASLRQPAEVVELAEAGVRCFTMSPAVVEALLEEPLTHQANEDFERASVEVTGGPP